MPVCTQCGRETGAARDTCLYCGGMLAAKPRGQLGCPRCGATMKQEIVDGLELDLCQACGGTWYDRGELEQHLAATTPTADDGDAPPDREFTREADRMDTRYLKCPVCTSPMTRKNWGRLSGVIVDICGPHGLFLDPGELERIRDFEGSATRARADRLETWEQARTAEEQRKDLMRARRVVQTELRRSRVGLLRFFR